jgi:hypothetical protein
LGGRAGYICVEAVAYNRRQHAAGGFGELDGVIVSASYRTDIPAFYARWFMHRLAAGRCRVANPHGSGEYEVLLTPQAVDGFVLWTRNIRPLLPELDGVREVAPFVVQFTLTGDPRALWFRAYRPPLTSFS